MKATQDRTGSMPAASAKNASVAPPAPSFEADRQQPHLFGAEHIAKPQVQPTAVEAIDLQLNHLYDAVALLRATEDRIDWTAYTSADERHHTLRLCQMAREKVASAADALFHAERG